MNEKQTSLFAVVRGYWNLDGDIVPWPWARLKIGLRCWACQQQDLLLKSWRFFNHPDDGQHTWLYRCDVQFKCTRCSANQPLFGVPTPKEMNQYWGPRKLVTRRMYDSHDPTSHAAWVEAWQLDQLKQRERVNEAKKEMGL